MIAKPIEPIEPGNPFLHDAYHMGVQIGSNVVIMMDNHKVQPCKYFIVVNTDTGERIKITL